MRYYCTGALKVPASVRRVYDLKNTDRERLADRKVFIPNLQMSS